MCARMFLIAWLITAIQKDMLGKQKALVTNYDATIKNKANLHELQKTRDKLNFTGQNPDCGKLYRPNSQRFLTIRF